MTSYSDFTTFTVNKHGTKNHKFLVFGGPLNNLHVSIDQITEAGLEGQYRRFNNAFRDKNYEKVIWVHIGNLAKDWRHLDTLT